MLHKMSDPLHAALAIGDRCALVDGEARQQDQKGHKDIQAKIARSGRRHEAAATAFSVTFTIASMIGV